MKNKIKRYILVAGMCVLGMSGYASANSKGDSEIVRSLDIFNALFKELNTFYVDSLDAKKNIENAINGMLGSIDPYTEYVPAQDVEDYRVLSTGEYGGIGSGIVSRNGSAYFSEPYEGTPAALAGIRPGDKIVMIDGDSVQSLSLDKVSAKLKGEQNTTVTVLVNRKDVGDLEFKIVRKKIKQNPVPYYGVQRGNIGYISLTTFNINAVEGVRKALLELKADKRVDKIVLDLRGNGGGLLESAVQIVGMFVPKGTEVLTQKGRVKQNTRTYKTTQEPVDTEIPLVVLIDGSSASSSEIVAGSLQDLDRAVIVGNRSFGKGLVQTSRPLPFDGLLHVTIAKYYIPSGRLIQAIDYSHRNADGTVQRIPDSLTNVYHTVNGREVRDGGGITPDVEVKYKKVNRLAYNIVRDYWAFDFATKYRNEHETIGAVEDFVVTDSIYNEFKAFIDPSKFQYDKVCEDGLKQLREVAETEGYMNDSTKAVFAQLENMLKHDLNKDLDLNRALISQILAVEIVRRYYYERGESIQELKEDEGLDEVVKLFATEGEYARILSGPSKKENKIIEKKK